ncbi:rhomboid domain-containing protein 3 isoform X2 [Syngnathus typhle]|uniref:rhomboid domain-containing protein 3 isoform X2 n=1 Tax=Syngnathus typhle TaxID=161592 RepID=UPI002A6B8A11|nr:rhomboid domain-containing protein 3 isoform X2 [Syngnathus typhle]
MVYAAGPQASLSLGPGGEFPRFRDVFLYALNHDDSPALLVSVVLLLLLGPRQERHWGTVAYLALSVLTMTVLPLIYTRLQGCLPVWILPWLLLLLFLIMLPGSPALLHFCAICIGHNYNHSFIEMLQELEKANFLTFIPSSAYIPTLCRLRLPTYSSSQMSQSQFMHDSHAPPSMRDLLTLNHHPWEEPLSVWRPESEAEVLEEHMLRAGILASLQNAPEEVDQKVEVPKSSVSALRLQQLEKMGFPTEKAVVALAASKQLDDVISLLVDDSIGEQAVVIAKGKKTTPPKGP